MKNLRQRSGVRLAAIAASASLLAAVPGLSQEGEIELASLVEGGKVSYASHCAACHGTSGEGDGPVAEYLTIEPTDLTRIADPGEFPFESVYDAIDGRAVPGHGTREMPVWGPALTGLGEAQDRRAVREKISEIVYFVKSLQRADR